MRYRKVGWVLHLCVLLAEGIASAAIGQQVSQSQPAAAESETAVVHVTVTDRDHHPVPALRAEDFVLSEDDRPLQITAVSSDVPACIGLVVDNSGSMRYQLSGVAGALLEFARAGNPDDRFFVVNFNDLPYVDQDFTHNINQVEEGLRHANARGGTALYDAVIASADHLAKARDCRKRVLAVVSDGSDNESRESLQQTIQALQNSEGSFIYAFGLEEKSPSRRAQHALETLAAATGGAVFFVGSNKDLGKALRQTADEIRGQYTISYIHNRAAPGAASGKLKLGVRTPEHLTFIVRANSPVRADQPAAAANQPVGDNKKSPD